MKRGKNYFVRFTITVLFAGAVVLTEAQVASQGKFPMISAHRGASRNAPENTIEAFSKAIKLGADFIEIDVRTTADGAQVIMHDGSLKRTTGLDAKVERTTLASIQELSAGQWFGEDFKMAKVPTLEEVCEFARKENRTNGQSVKLYVDCKDINTGEVVRILNQYSLLDSAVFYGDLVVLKEIRKFSDRARLMPAYPGKEKMKKVIHKIKPYAFDVSPSDLNEEIISMCHMNGVRVFSDLLGEYDRPEVYRKAIGLHVDLIQTDDVSALMNTYNEFKKTIPE